MYQRQRMKGNIAATMMGGRGGGGAGKAQSKGLPGQFSKDELKQRMTCV